MAKRRTTQEEVATALAPATAANDGSATLPIPAAGGLAKPVDIAAMCVESYKGPPMQTSLPNETEEDRIRLFNIVSSHCTPLTECHGEVIPVVHYIAERAVMQFEDDALPALGVRIWLINDKGEAFFSAARSIANCLERVAIYFGLGPYDPPMRLAFTKSNTRKGRLIWNVERVVE